MNDKITLRIFFAILFMMLPYIVAHFIPTNLIYSWKENPIKTDKEVYRTCETISWTMYRKSFLPLRARVTERIIDGSPVLNRSYDIVVLPVNKWKKVKASWENICLPPDIYYLQGIVEFDLMGITKQHFFETQSFKVVE